MLVKCPACCKTELKDPGKYHCTICGYYFIEDNNGYVKIAGRPRRDQFLQYSSIPVFIIAVMMFLAKEIAIISIALFVVLLAMVSATIVLNIYDYKNYKYVIFRYSVARKGDGLILAVIFVVMRIAFYIFLVLISIL